MTRAMRSGSDLAVLMQHQAKAKPARTVIGFGRII
jgi:hypothetical protein